MEDGPCYKKPRYMESWEYPFFNKTTATPRFRLVDLFGRKLQKTPSDGQQIVQGVTSDQLQLPFTLRLEHRNNDDEERILIFRSDRPGVIAKIIYSSSPADVSLADQGDKTVAHAKVHSLFVHPSYRGYDLGGLLFSAAMESLRKRYVSKDDNQTSTQLSSVRCRLDAEEETERHNQLVGFYQKLGCHVRPEAKILFMPNNDGMIRKVPMQIQLRPHPRLSSRTDQDQLHSQEYGSLVERSEQFLPIILKSGGKKIRFSLSKHDNDSNVDWLLVDTGNGLFEFRTTQLSTLVVATDGRCVTAPSDLDDEKYREGAHSSFQLLRASDGQQRVLQFEESLDDDSTPDEARKRELWMFQSVHGTFLRADPNNLTLQCSNDPAFWQWQADDNKLSLTCTSDTPARRHHYRKMWSKQTLECVTALRKRYLDFNVRTMPLKTALDLVKTIPGTPFAAKNSSVSPSLRTLCYRTAEIAHASGYPDWVQFIALVHGLGSVMNCIDVRTATETELDYDWTICGLSRVVGCMSRADASFSEFRALNPDERDERYRSPLGIYEINCGLKNVFLTWTGPEYMYHMLQHNQVDIPEEGLSMLRLFRLYDWHEKGHYVELADDDDNDVLPFVQDFDKLRQSAMRSYRTLPELSDEECNELWDTKYVHIVRKYGADKAMKW